MLFFRRSFFIIFLFSSFSVFSQTDQSKIAYQYYLNGEYEKASELYKEVIKREAIDRYYFPYFQSLLKSNNYVEAVKLSKRMCKKHSNKIIYLVDLGYVQKRSNQEEQSINTYNQVYQKINGQQQQVVMLGNAFIRYQEYNEALKCYMIARKLNPSNSFSIQVAQLYLYLEQDDKMVNEYLFLLKEHPEKKQYVLNSLERYLNNDGIESNRNYNFVKEGLLRYSEQENYGSLFSEMLIWLFMYNNQFDLAFLQAKALDQRLRGDGGKLYDLAESFLSNKYYSLCIKVYDYIIQKGSGYYYIDSHINKLYCLGKLSINKQSHLASLDSLYKKTISELGYNRNTISLILNYAHFQGFMMHDLESAEYILEEAMNIANLSKFDLAECKLVYADIMLLSNKIWTSLLYYSQVEKDFKEHPIGHEAKLRRSKVAYYQGDFDWAQAQLDVLKSSTSKLISNDAMDLSLLIADNLNLDTSAVPMEMYARADLFYFQHRYKEANLVLDSILFFYQGHSLSDEIYFRKHEIYTELEKLDSAIHMLNIIIDNYSYDVLGDDAVFYLAKIYYERGESERAFNLYEKMLIEFQGSIYISESRKRYREIRGDEL